MSPAQNRRAVWAILLVAILLRLPTFLYEYANIDETDLTLAGRIILEGGLPYRDCLIYQPPIIYYLYALGFWLAGGIHLWAVHLLAVLFAALTSLTLYALVKRMTESIPAGVAAGLAYALYSTLFIPQDMLAANCEILMMLPMSLGALFLWKADREDRKRFYFAAGFFFGLGVLTKYQGGILLLAALSYVVIGRPWLRRRFQPAEVGRHVLFLMGGFGFPFIAFLAYFYFKGVLPHTLELFKYIVLYTKNPPQTDFVYVLLKFAVRTFLFALTGIPIWIGGLHVVRRWFGRSPDNPLPHFTLFPILWFFFSLPALTAGGRIYFHYYFIILPAVAILYGLWWRLRRDQVRRWVRNLTIGWVVFTLVGWEAYMVISPMPPYSQKETWRGVAQHMKSISKPEETLFIWGLCYPIYFFSGLKPATRFTSADYLTGRFPMTAGLEYDPKKPNPPSPFEKLYYDFVDRPGVISYDTSENIFWKAWDYFREDMAKKKPTYIIDTSPSNYRRYGRYPISDFPEMDSLVRNHYRKIDSIDGYDIYRLKK